MSIPALIAASQMAGAAQIMNNQQQYIAAMQQTNQYANQLAGQIHAQAQYNSYPNQGAPVPLPPGFGWSPYGLTPEYQNKHIMLLNTILDKYFETRSPEFKQKITAKWWKKSDEDLLNIITNIFSKDSIEYYITLSEDELYNYLILIA